MTEAERRSSSTSEVKKDPFRYVPDIIDERSRDVDGMIVNRYTKGLILGKVSIARTSLSVLLSLCSSMGYVGYNKKRVMSACHHWFTTRIVELYVDWV